MQKFHTLISQVTDVVIEEVRQWGGLEALYPIVVDASPSKSANITG